MCGGHSLNTRARTRYFTAHTKARSDTPPHARTHIRARAGAQVSAPARVGGSGEAAAAAAAVAAAAAAAAATDMRIFPAFMFAQRTGNHQPLLQPRTVSHPIPCGRHTVTGRKTAQPTLHAQRRRLQRITNQDGQGAHGNVVPSSAHMPAGLPAQFSLRPGPAITARPSPACRAPWPTRLMPLPFLSVFYICSLSSSSFPHFLSLSSSRRNA